MMRNGKQIDMAVFSQYDGITSRKDAEIRVSGETEDYQYGG